MFLTATSHSLEVVTTTTAAIDVCVDFVEHSATGGVVDSQQSQITTATDTTICTAPAASKQRQVKGVWIRNISNSASNQITVQKDVSGVEHLMATATLQPGESLCYAEATGWQVRTQNGAIKTVTNDASQTGGYPIPFYKLGTVAEAVGTPYCFAKDAGTPGVWAPGTPGLAGRATDGLAVADAGCICPSDASPGSNWLAQLSFTSTVALSLQFIDILWINSGNVVTTITAQTVNSVALPARDRLGTADGTDVQIGILVTTATTNAAQITNMTVSYTNSNGVAGRTATMPAFNATAVIGTFLWFRLQAGDTGVRSIQSHTNGTSLVTGAVSLVMFCLLDQVGCPLANAGQLEPRVLAAQYQKRIYDRTCGHLVSIPTSTTAPAIHGVVGIASR